MKKDTEKKEKENSEPVLIGGMRDETSIAANLSVNIICYLFVLKKRLAAKGIIDDKNFDEEYLDRRREMIDGFNKDLGLKREKE